MKRKILVVEDEAFVAMMLRTRLEANNFAVVTAGDGLEGLAKVTSEKPDLILLDVLLPKLDGFHFVEELRKRKDDTRTIPVIVLSARESMRTLFNPKDISAFFSKPFDSGELLESIQKFLKASLSTRGTTNKALIIGAEWEAMRPIKEVLEKHDFFVYVARDAHQAIQEAVQHHPDVIFAPSLVAGMDVWEMCNIFRDLPVTKEIPFVIYDLGSLGENAMPTVKASLVIDYNSHEELRNKTENFIKKHF